MKKDFSKLKETFIEKTRAAGACRDEFRRVINSETEADLLLVIKDNLPWCVEKKVISSEFFSGFTPEIFYASGIANTGEDNTGYSNTGDSNTGDWNTGDRNTGDRNTGYSNTGDWNTGDRNTGYSNTGDGLTGFFCTGEKNPKIPIFNKPSEWTITDVQNSRAMQLMLNNVDTKMWISESRMTEEEKVNFPSYKTTGGYLKDIPFKEAFSNAWHNWSDESKSEFKELPNFDAAVFEEITGVKI